MPLDSCVALVSYITSLNLNHFICKMGIRTVPLKGFMKNFDQPLGDAPG